MKEKGNAAFKTGDFELAINYYSQAIGEYSLYIRYWNTINFENPTEWFDQEIIYYSNRAAAYISTKRFHLGLADCQRAVLLQPNNPTAKVLLRLGRCHFALGNTMPALTALRQTLAIEPENSVAEALHKKVLGLQGHVRNFESARSRGH